MQEEANQKRIYPGTFVSKVSTERQLAGKSHSNRMKKRTDWSLWPQPWPYQKRIIIPQADGRLLVYLSFRPWNKKIVRFLSQAKRFLDSEYRAWEKESTRPRCIKGQFQRMQTVIVFDDVFAIP